MKQRRKQRQLEKVRRIKVTQRHGFEIKLSFSTMLLAIDRLIAPLSFNSSMIELELKNSFTQADAFLFEAAM
jgi:hypothetical protein